MSRNLVVVLLACIVLGLAIYLAFDIYKTAEEEVLTRFNECQLLIARRVAHQLEMYLAGLTTDLQALSSLPSVQYHDQKRMTVDVLKLFDRVRTIHVTEISIYDEDGTALYSTTARVIGSNLPRTVLEWAKNGESKGRVYVFSPIRVVAAEANQPSPHRPSYHQWLAMPLYQETIDDRYPKPTERFAGILSMTTDVKELFSEQFAQASAGTMPQQAWMMAKDGTLLFQSEHPEMVGRNIYQADTRCNQCHFSFNHAAQMLRQTQGTVEYQLKGYERKLAAFAPVQFGNILWIAVVNVAYDEVTSFERKEHMKMLWLLGVVLLTIGFTSHIVYRNYRLRETAEEEAKNWRERHVLEEKIHESQKLYRALFDQSPDGVLIIDPETMLPTIFNDVACQQLGYSREEFAKLRISDYEAVEKPEETKARIKRILSKGGDEFETKHRTKQGEIRYVGVTVRWLELADHPLLHCIFHDITQHKQSEQQLTESHTELRRLAEHLRSVREEERADAARAIHDELGQALTILKMDLTGLQNKLSREGGPLEQSPSEKITSMSRLVDETIKSVRRIAADLRPAVLDDLGIVAAIEWKARELQEKTGIECKLTVEPRDITLDRDRSTDVFRIFQEAMTNVIRHANASKTEIGLRLRDGSLVLEVEDNGRGITKDEISNTKSFGLLGVRERALAWGGEVAIHSAPGEGTKLTVRIPVSGPAAA
ncbi:MAG: PAS domain S-box protein [Acidobacteria bacterium]|nr:PAS domain S-box protein [Acidobacteriota bacterium]